jgi:hypothetical protein
VPRLRAPGRAFARLAERLIALVFGVACALQRAVAVLLGVLGACELARGPLLGSPCGALGCGLGGDSGLAARNRVLRAVLGVLGERLGVSLAPLGVPRPFTRGLFCRLRLCCGRECRLGRFVGLQSLAAGTRLLLGGAADLGLRVGAHRCQLGFELLAVAYYRQQLAGACEVVCEALREHADARDRKAHRPDGPAGRPPEPAPCL